MNPEVKRAVDPLFLILPLAEAMPSLLPKRLAADEVLDLVEQVAETDLFRANPALLAGLWLYVDDLERSHEVSQGLNTTEGAFWHAVMHRREGDFSNSKYWLDRIGPLSNEAPFHPSAFVDEVSALHEANPPELLEKQRDEWWWLFTHCAGQVTP